MVILSPQALTFLNNGCEVFFDGVSESYNNIFVIKDFLKNYKNYNIEDVYRIVKTSFVFYRNSRFPLFTLLPCNRCTHCRNDYRSEIEKRAIIEAANSGTVIFYTLTYDSEHEPIDGLYKKHVQDAFKRLRSYIDRYLDFNCTFTQLYVGEYGTDVRYTLRPHYHGIIFIEEKLNSKQLLQLEDLFRPKECQIRRNIALNNKLIYKLKAKSIKASEFYKEHSKLLGFWPHGVLYDFQIARNPVALCRYVTKYITKNVDFINNSDSFALSREKRERTFTPFFIQLPKSIGLGVKYLDLYRDSILNSTDFSIYVRFTRNTSCAGLIRIGIPKIFIQKLFPSLSYYCDNSIYTSYLIKFLLDHVSIVNNVYRNYPLAELTNLKTRFISYKYLTKQTLKRYQKLRLNIAKCFYINTLHNHDYRTNLFNYNETDEYEENLLTIIEKLLDNLKNCPTEEEYFNLTFTKSQWYLKKKIPPYDYQSVLQQKIQKIQQNTSYVRRKMLHSSYNNLY
ncbi:replication initiator protein [Sigmofec virus UA08Rod_5080]|uniref:Replication initiator protein n=1 Tax=Sigmofec virus UA08Rod_5080 TaxID=2929414 RepID=A0A976N1A3_9VIRU|nr:replication initiator protein [Sigmofec virus UA08Rod_5080]